MLYTNQILEFMKKDDSLRSCFLGVFPCDRLPDIRSYPAGFIVNTDYHDQPGEHWLSIYINKFGIGYFFDSFGQLPRTYDVILENFLDDNCIDWKYNTKMYQNVLSDVCGYYAIFVQIYLCHGFEIDEIKKLLSNKTYDNDYIVKNFIVKYFKLVK